MPASINSFALLRRNPDLRDRRFGTWLRGVYEEFGPLIQLLVCVSTVLVTKRGRLLFSRRAGSVERGLLRSVVECWQVFVTNAAAARLLAWRNPKVPKISRWPIRLSNHACCHPCRLRHSVRFGEARLFGAISKQHMYVHLN